MFEYILDSGIRISVLNNFGQISKIHIFQLVCRSNVRKDIFGKLSVISFDLEHFKHHKDNFQAAAISITVLYDVIMCYHGDQIY